MKTYIVEEKISGNSNLIISIIKNFDNILSYIPYQVERGYNEITLRFTRFLLFSYKQTFKLENKIDTKSMVTYVLKSSKGDILEIFISIKEEKPNQTNVNIAIKYDGEKEWIVGKFLHEIASSISHGIKEESKRAESITISTNFSENLSKLSFLTKLLMKSRLVKTDEITVGKGQLVSSILNIIQEFLRYQIIYVSGTSVSSSFRLIFINGEEKGVYVNIEGKESFDEKELNELEGHFKINIYVSLMPEEILKGVINEGA
ncbi:hypothetical protein [Sulfurisphaera javensis]|uniref:hypothetical protein n=1 Tax=Sulfurisphaera javensis TaxID=2049879 RepID=UPI0034E842D5